MLKDQVYAIPSTFWPFHMPKGIPPLPAPHPPTSCLSERDCIPPLLPATDHHCLSFKDLLEPSSPCSPRYSGGHIAGTICPSRPWPCPPPVTGSGPELGTNLPEPGGLWEGPFSPQTSLGQHRTLHAAGPQRRPTRQDGEWAG